MLALLHSFWYSLSEPYLSVLEKEWSFLSVGPSWPCCPLLQEPGWGGGGQDCSPTGQAGWAGGQERVDTAGEEVWHWDDLYTGDLVFRSPPKVYGLKWQVIYRTCEGLVAIQKRGMWATRVTGATSEGGVEKNCYSLIGRQSNGEPLWGRWTDIWICGCAVEFMSLEPIISTGSPTSVHVIKKY